MTTSTKTALTPDDLLVTDDDLRALESEAGAAGDTTMARWAVRARQGSRWHRSRCETVIRAHRAEMA